LLGLEVILVQTIEVSIVLETLLTDNGLNQLPDCGMGINGHGAILAALLATVAAFRKEVTRLVAVVVWVLQVDCQGKVSLILVEL
jgi:hypothetical protein